MNDIGGARALEPEADLSVESGKAPLVFGVTGHRDLVEQDRASLEAAVRAEFLRFRKRYPHTPFLLLSPLAEGADRLVARVALNLGMRLIAVLPMDRSEYERDFKTEELRDEFANLLAKACRVVERPLCEGVKPEDITRPGPDRDRQYESANAWMAKHCQVLLALWNGKESGLVGGTASLVSFYRSDVPRRIVRPSGTLDLPDIGVVVHVVTPRARDPECVGTPFTVRRLYPSRLEGGDSVAIGGVGATPPSPSSRGAARAEAIYDRIFRRMDDYNRDVERGGRRWPQDVEQSKGYVIPESRRDLLSEPSMRLLDAYGHADALAIRYGRYYRAALVGIVALAFASFSAYELYSHLLRTHDFLLAMNFFLLLLAAFWYFRASPRSLRIQDRYLDYRALAEGLRVQLFWSIAGIDEDVSNHYLRKQSGELDWIRNAIRTLRIGAACEPTGGHAPVELKALDLVNACWVLDQHRFFQRTFLRDHRKERLLKWFVYGLFLLGPAFVLALVVLGAVGGGVSEHLKEILLVSIGLSLVASAMIEFLAERSALGEHIRQYGRMIEMYGAALGPLEARIQAGDGAFVQDVLTELGKESLVENGDWVLMHRARPLDLPKG